MQYDKHTVFAHSYGKELGEWWSQLCDEADAETSVVAIARKCPRLFDIIKRELVEPDGKQESFFEHVITEHALPFHFHSDARQSDIKKYILCDDSILFGSTYSKISDFIDTLHKKRDEKSLNESPGDIKIIYRPFAFNEDIFNEDEIIKSIKDEKKYSLPISDKEGSVSAFINREMSAILTEGPYDIEFPIFTWEFNSADDDLVSKIDHELRKFAENIGLKDISNSFYENVYDTVLYATVDGVSSPVKSESVAWTLLIHPMNERSNRYNEPEFCKLRFFLNAEKRKLKVVSYSPYPVTNDVIRHFASFLPDNEFKKLYTLPYECVKDILNLTDGAQDNSVQYLQYQTERSLVIWINYLLSLNRLLLFKKELSELKSALGCKDHGIDKREVRYLLGSSLANELYPLLSEWIRETEWTIDNFYIDFSSVYSNNFKEKIIPEDYYADFINETSKEYSSCLSVKELVSRHFDIQHRFLDKKRRRPSVNKYKRLRYGITYRGLYYDVRFYNVNLLNNARSITQIVDDDDVVVVVDDDTWFYDRSNLISKLHQAMDEHIDKGSVVPKYIKLENRHKPVWTRLFRAGERVTPLKEIEYLSMYLISLLQSLLNEKNGPNSINPITLECYLLHTIGNSLYINELMELFGFSLKRRIRDMDGFPMLCLAFNISNTQEIFLSDWIKYRGYIVECDFSTEYKLKVENKPQEIPLPYGIESLKKKFDSMANFFAAILENHQQSRTFYSYILKFSLLGIKESEEEASVKDLQLKFFVDWKNDFTESLNDIKQCNVTDKAKISQINLRIYLYQNYYRYVDIDQYLDKKVFKENRYFENQLRESENLFRKDIDEILYVATLLNVLINISLFNSDNVIIVDEKKVGELCEKQGDIFAGLEKLLGFYRSFKKNKLTEKKDNIIAECDRLFNLIIDKYP